MFFLIPASFGDIVTAANLAFSIYQSLKNSAGASEDYQFLIDELFYFERALRAVDSAVSNSNIQGPLAQDIRTEAAACIDTLKPLHSRIRRYSKLLDGKTKGVSWRSIGWGIFQAGELRSFREKIAQRKHNLTLLSNSLAVNAIAYNRDEIRETMISIRTEIVNLQRQIPQSVGYQENNSVTLINAFGERITLIWETCFSPERLHETLQTYFKGKYGECFVQQRRYELSTEDGNSVIIPSQWEKFVKKGSVVVMNMLVLKQISINETEQKMCPHCGVTPIGLMNDRGWLQCRHCERRFLWESGQILDGHRGEYMNTTASISAFRHIRVVVDFSMDFGVVVDSDSVAAILNRIVEIQKALIRRLRKAITH